MTSCDSDACKRYEWFYPDFYQYYISADVVEGDVLWYVEKSTAQSVIGLSDAFWQAYTDSSYTWKSHAIINGAAKGKTAWLHLTVNPGGMGDNYLGVEFTGTSYPSEAPAYNAQISNPENPVRTLVSNC